MADNIFRFRRLKWGDPTHKLKMLPPAERRTRNTGRIVDVLAALVLLVSVVVITCAVAPGF